MKKLLVTLLALVTFSTTSAWALDTLEPFPVGPNSVEFYFGGDGFGKDLRQNGSFTQTFQFDYGVTDKLSVYLAEEGTLSNGGNALGLTVGGYYPLLDSDHFDIDFGMELGSDLISENMAFAPYFEFTYDLNEARNFGLYLLVKEAIGGHLTHGLSSSVGFDLGTEIDVGALFTIAEKHQLLVGWSLEMAHLPEFEFAAGPLALGYNVLLTDAVELVTEVDFNLPTDEDKFSVGFSAGLIVAF